MTDMDVCEPVTDVACGNPFSLAETKILVRRWGIRIPTPVCALARNDKGGGKAKSAPHGGALEMSDFPHLSIRTAGFGTTRSPAGCRASQGRSLRHS